jgi:hydrogenase/urease accessory protein HupE
LPADVVACIAIALGLMHGYFNGAAMSAAGPFAGSLQLIGVSAVLFVMIAILSALVVALKPPWTRIVVRVAGSWIAAMGLLLLGWLMRPGA